MSTITLTLPKEYGLVVAAASLSFVSSVWHGFRVPSFRRAAQIPYPNYYPPGLVSIDSTEPLGKERYFYQCAQRAHSNFVENQPTFLASLFIAGLKYPLIAGATGIAWNLFRIVYTVGYTSQKAQGSGRYTGLWAFPLQIALIGMSGKVAWDMWFA